MRRLTRIILVSLAILLAACGVIEIAPDSYVSGVINGTPFSVVIVPAATGTQPPATLTTTPTSAPNTATATTVPTSTPTPSQTPTARPTVTPPPSGAWDYNVNPNFSADQLPAAARQPYADLIAAMVSPNQYPDLDGMAARGDLYRCGRLLRAGEIALLIAYRYTGDAALLDGVNRSMDKLRAEVVDHDNDGFRSILWWFELEQGSSYWGTDTHPMDNIMCHALVAAYTWSLVETNDPAYAERADWWTTYLFDDFVARWAARPGSVAGLPFKDLTHAYLGLIQLNYYLARLADATGRPSGQWWASANTYAAHVFDITFIPDGIYYRWDHRVLGYGKPLYGCQSSEYAGLTMIAVADLALEGFAPFSNPGVMARFAATWRDRVLTGGASAVAGDVCGTGSVNASKYMISFAPVLALWDATGQLVAKTAAIYNAGGYAGRNVLAPAGAFLYAVTGGQGGGEPPLSVSFAAPAVAAVVQATSFVRVYDETGNYTDYVPAGAVATETPHDTPTATIPPSATVTARATLTSTPTLTNTPSPTTTPTPGATFTAMPSPTQEPSYTPGPTFTPAPTTEPPPPDGCYGTVNVSLNIRTGPATLVNGSPVSAPLAGLPALAAGERVIITDVEYLDVSGTRTDEWAQIRAANERAGWAAARYNNSQYITYDTTPECLEVRFREAVEYPPMAFGMHNVIPEKAPSDMMSNYWRLHEAGIPIALFNVETTTGLNTIRGWGGLAALRVKRQYGHLQDCPSEYDDPTYAAHYIWQQTRAYFWAYAPPTSGIYIAVDNECGMLWIDLAWSDTYLSETIRLFGEEGFRMVIMNTIAGEWTRERVLGLPKTWAASVRYGAILGIHAYGIQGYEGSMLTQYPVSFAIDAPGYWWLWPYGGQHNQLREWLHENNPANDAILIWYTEVGFGMGHFPYVSWDCPRWWDKVRRDDAGVIAGACWTAGSGQDVWSADGLVGASVDEVLRLAR